MSYYQSARTTYENAQKEYKDVQIFYSTFESKDKQTILHYHAEDFKNFLKMVKKSNDSIFSREINTNGELFIENCTAKIVFAFLSGNENKINFYTNCFKIALKKTPVEIINKRYLSRNDKDMFQHAMNIITHTQDSSYLISLLNHFPQALLLNKLRKDAIFFDNLNNIFKDNKLFNLLKSSKYQQLFYPEDKDMFEHILLIFIECEKYYTTKDIYDFVKNINAQSESFIDEVYDDTGPMNILLNYFNENKNSSIIPSVIQKLVMDDAIIITPDEESNNLIRLIRENMLLKNILINEEGQHEVKKKIKRL